MYFSIFFIRMPQSGYLIGVRNQLRLYYPRSNTIHFSLPFWSFTMPEYTLRVNGASRTVRTDADTPLLYVLRNDLELNGPKFGCGLAQCGACTVHVDGRAARSCVTPVSSLAGKAVTTLEGLGTLDKLHPLQKAFLDEQAAQCGYCTSGMIMSAKALLDNKPNPSAAEIKNALAGNLCRCGTHNRIVRAVQRAASSTKGGAA
jgi:nicotinate dehydrogenase subunit A